MCQGATAGKTCKKILTGLQTKKEEASDTRQMHDNSLAWWSSCMWFVLHSDPAITSEKYSLDCIHRQENNTQQHAKLSLREVDAVRFVGATGNQKGKEFEV
jgi:hypothetical protein